ncbi:MAG: cyclase family protein [Bacteroidia bacterium]
MQLIIEWNGKSYKVQTEQAIDLSIPMRNGTENPNAFQIPHPVFEPIRVGDFVGSVAAGSSANCENLLINAHGNGTHTECIGHITKERITINESLKEFFFIAQLISLPKRKLFGNQEALLLQDAENLIQPGVQALLLRSEPNHVEKLRMNYSGNIPACIEPALASHVASLGIKHLLVDLPSVDPEHDDGKMEAHKAFWKPGDASRLDCTITEMFYAHAGIPDGIYLLNLQIAALETDASPSKPILYQLIES